MPSPLQPWTKIRTRQLADCRIFTVEESTSVSPKDGVEHQFYVVESADWVNIVPITEDNEVVCIRQYRHGTDEITLEIPGGLVDLGEEPKEAAMRECLEETGYRVTDATSLGVLRPNPALFPNKLYTYLARGAVQVAEISNTATEETRLELIPLDDLDGLLRSGEIDHALVAATLWRLLFHLQRE